MVGYTYILRSKKDGNLYIGSTKCLKARLEEHIKGRVPSTKSRRPLMLIGWRKFDNHFDAVIFEKKYKNSHGQLERDFKNGKINIYRKQ